jgi:hypothetical protein
MEIDSILSNFTFFNSIPYSRNTTYKYFSCMANTIIYKYILYMSHPVLKIKTRYTPYVCPESPHIQQQNETVSETILLTYT